MGRGGEGWEGVGRGGDGFGEGSASFMQSFVRSLKRGIPSSKAEMRDLQVQDLHGELVPRGQLAMIQAEEWRRVQLNARCKHDR